MKALISMLILTVVACAVSIAGLRILKTEQGQPRMLFESKELIERAERRRHALGVAAVIAVGFVVLLLLWGAILAAVDYWRVG